MCESVRTGVVACVWLRAVCASVCVWNVLSVCVMRLVCRPGVSLKILNTRVQVASYYLADGYTFQGGMKHTKVAPARLTWTGSDDTLAQGRRQLHVNFVLV